MSIFDKNRHSTSDIITEFPSSSSLQKFFSKLPKGGKGYIYLHINIVNMQDINEIFGYELGLGVLVSVQNILKECIQNAEATGHITVCKYAMLLKVESREQFLVRFSSIEKQLRGVKVTNGNIPLSYRCLFSYGMYEIVGTEESLLEVEYMAVEASKLLRAQGKTGVSFLEDDIQKSIQLRMKLDNTIDEAMEKQQIEGYFQPVYAVKTKMLSGIELIGRWNHPEFGMVELKEVASSFARCEKQKLLDFYLFEMACQTLKGWIAQECVPIVIIVKISKYSLYEVNFATELKKMIDQYDVLSRLIVLKIDCKIIQTNDEIALEILSELHRLGFMIVLNNFAEKHIAVDVLHNFPIADVALSPTFLKKALESTSYEATLRSLVSIVHKFKSVVSVSGMSEDQYLFFKKNGCDHMQGNLYSDLKSLKEIEEIVFEN